MDSSDLQFFASTDPKQIGIQYPWSDSEHTYASDGGILIRVPRITNVPPNPQAPATAGKLIIATSQNPGRWCPIPEIKLPDLADCVACHGTGKCACPCCQDEHTCKLCNSTGKLPESMFVGNLRFLVRHVRLLKELPECQWCLAEQPAIYFKFKLGDGILRCQTN
jgi:hypothetical protein